VVDSTVLPLHNLWSLFTRNSRVGTWLAPPEFVLCTPHLARQRSQLPGSSLTTRSTPASRCAANLTRQSGREWDPAPNARTLSFDNAIPSG